METGGAAVDACLDFPMVLGGENNDPAAALRRINSLVLPEHPEIFRTGDEITPTGERGVDAGREIAPGNGGRIGRNGGGFRGLGADRDDGVHRERTLKNKRIRCGPSESSKLPFLWSPRTTMNEHTLAFAVAGGFGWGRAGSFSGFFSPPS
jgi:hypothetical protein